MSSNNITLVQNDLPASFKPGKMVAIDTETMGLNPHRDRLCLVQICNEEGQVYLVKIAPYGDGVPKAPNLIKILEDPSIKKIMHFGRFDVAIMQHAFKIRIAGVICTKIAARLVRTFTDKHGLRNLCRELLDVEISKQQQCSDWGAPDLTEEQMQYAASDVLYLHRLWAKLEKLLEREHRLELAQACFDFLPIRAELDLLGYDNSDIFAHRA